MGFYLELTMRAGHSLIEGMGTTALAWITEFAGLPILVFLVIWTRRGSQYMRQSWQENLKDTAIVTALVWASLYAYHFLHKVPHEITEAANNARAPMPAMPIPPRTDETKSLK